MKFKGFEGFAIDIGGPCRVSDKEMKRSEDIAYRKQYGHKIKLKPWDAWQLYGLMSAERYVGFVKAALAIERSGIKYKDFLKKEDPVAVLEDAIRKYIPESELKIINRVAKEAEDHYNAHQSRRLARGAERALKILKSRDIPRSLVTSLYTGAAREWVEKNLPGFFDPELIFGVEKDTPRGYDPKPEQLLKSAEIIGIKPAELVYVGDTRGDMIACKEAGCSIALIRKGMTPPILFGKYLEEMPYFKEGKNFFIVKNLLDAVKRLSKKK